jgi:hypothetical protein
MHRTITALVALGLTGALSAGLCTGIASPARAADVSGVVIATTTADDTLVVAKSPTATAVASLPRGIEVTNHGGKPVVVSTQGKAPMTKPRPGNAPATFTGLEAGRSYTVSVGGKVIGTVVAVSEPASASSLVVRATASPTTVDMSWQATPTAQTGPLTYDITASAEGKPVVRSTVKDVLTARLAGLDPRALYTFSVVARNTAGAAAAVSATMTRSLADITGRDGDIAVTAVKAIEPAPAPASSAAPPAPAAPTTRTIYVCLDGFVDAGSTCTKTIAYTFSTITYTFHTETSPGGPCNYLPNPNSPTGLDIYCPPPIVSTVKDATPGGYTDNGTSWIKRDATPTGYTDNGSAWVTTTAKVAREVPA